MFNLGPGEIAVVVIAILLIFGPRKLPELAKSLGASINEFRKSMANPEAADTSAETAKQLKQENPEDNKPAG
jgi:sec-independent protein translocase protein TatA